jgi:hypothetical protein
MKLLAIDPGNVESGICHFFGKDIWLEKPFGKLPNNEVLGIVKKGNVDQIAIEFPIPRGMPASLELFLTVEWIGRFKAAALDNGTKFDYIDRARVKMVVCGAPSATDTNIRAALIDIYGEPGTKNAPGPTYGFTKDAWAALGVGHTYIEEGESMSRVLARKEAKKVERLEKTKEKKEKTKALKEAMQAAGLTAEDLKL